MLLADALAMLLRILPDVLLEAARRRLPRERLVDRGNLESFRIPIRPRPRKQFPGALRLGFLPRPQHPLVAGQPAAILRRPRALACNTARIPRARLRLADRFDCNSDPPVVPEVVAVAQRLALARQQLAKPRVVWLQRVPRRIVPFGIRLLEAPAFCLERP